MLANVKFLFKICDYCNLFKTKRHHHFEVDVIRKNEKSDILDRIDELIVTLTIFEFLTFHF